MEHIMTLHNVSASYDGREVLSDLSLDIPVRRITAVMRSVRVRKNHAVAVYERIAGRGKGCICIRKDLLDGQEIKSMQKDVLAAVWVWCFRRRLPFHFPSIKT